MSQSNSDSPRSSAPPSAPAPATRGGALRTLKQEYRERTPGWSRWLFSVSITLMVIGVGLSVWSAMREEAVPIRVPAGESGSGLDAADPLAAQSLTGRSGAADAGRSAEVVPAAWTRGWGPVVFRLGFSFFVAFAIAYTLRLFLTWALVLVGVVAGLIILLQYLGLITFSWNDVESRSQGAVGWAQGQFGSFMEFAKGVLPSSAAAAAGLFAGWRRK